MMNEVATMVTSRPEKSLSRTERLARGLGWFSIGLGVAELVAPGTIGRMLGLEDQKGLLRAFGGREIASGVGVLSDFPTPALWSRVAGDMLDLGTLAFAARDSDPEQRRNIAIAAGAVGVVALADLFAASSLQKKLSQDRGETRDYSDRSGFPGGTRGATSTASREGEKKQMEVELAPA
jgi:hypothetical protein